MSGVMVFFQDAVRQVTDLDVPTRMAKAGAGDVNPVDVEALWRGRVARAFVRSLPSEWSDKEAADAIGIDKADVSRWKTGERRVQIDKVLAHPVIGPRFVFEQAELLPQLATARSITFPGGGR